jgi:PEP-CTERM motif
MSSGGGNASSFANATGGAGGLAAPGSDLGGGAAGSATAIAKAVATGGGGAGSLLGAFGVANATSRAKTAKGALAQAQSTAVGSSGQAQSTAQTSYSFVKVQSAAAAQVGSTATTNAIAQGGAGQAFINPGQTAYAFSTALPDKAYSAALIDGAHNVAGALLGPRDMVFGTAILGANYAADGAGESRTYSATSTFDFGYGGDLLLGLIGSQENGFAGALGFQSMEFTIVADGVEILDTTFKSLSIAESFFRDSVINLGSSLGPDIDLTFGYTLVADGSGGFGFDLAVGGAVPEPSTWAMMVLGFAGLGYAGYRQTREPRFA